MFADSVCESSWTDRVRRTRVSLISFSLQALAVGTLFLLPLLYTQGLPQMQYMSSLVAPAAWQPPVNAPRTLHPAASHTATSNEVALPNYETRGIVESVASSAPPVVDASQLNIWSGTGRGGNVFGGTGLDVSVAPPPPVVVAKPPRVSRMMEGNLIRRVQPVYPALARQARIQGAVILRAVISRDGTIVGLQTLSGHPMLVKAALDAVRQWQYRPYYLNGEAIEVETQITVNFTLGG